MDYCQFKILQVQLSSKLLSADVSSVTPNTTGVRFEQRI